jgi:hypothetical protein
VDVANMALSRIGAQSINSFLASDPTSIICNTNFPLAVLEVVRAGRWSALLTPTQLTATANPMIVPSGVTPITGVPWAPNTAYLANAFLTYGNYFYTVNFSYTSSANFTNDLTNGDLSQTDQQAGTSVPDPFCGYANGSQFVSGWGYAYLLPADFQLLVTLNDNWCYGNWGGLGGESAQYEIMGAVLYCDEAQAIIQYVQTTIDTTRFDSLFTECLALKLASMIATPLRQDDGNMAAALLGEYKTALKDARAKNGGERVSRRFNPIPSSNFNRARWAGSNG